MFANGYKCQHLGRTSYYDSSDDEYAHTATMNFTGTSGKKIADISLGHTRLCALFGDGMPKPPLQCIVESGEAIYVPTNWRHATCNLSPLTLSFGGQGDFGAFSGRQLIDAILDNDQAELTRLLQLTPPKRAPLLAARTVASAEGAAPILRTEAARLPFKL